MSSIVLAVAAAVVSLGAQPPAAEVTYRFTYAQPGDETVTIEMAWPEPLRDAAPLVMPRAIPMGYGEQHYDAFVSGVDAFAGTMAAAAPVREEGPRWRLAAGTTRVRYRVNLREMEREVRAASDASRVRDGYLGALGYSVFAYVDGHEHRPARLRVEGPSGWPVFCTLAPRWPVTADPVDGRAPNFYALADAQIVLGPRAQVRRLAETPAPLYLAAYAEGEVDLDRLGRLAATAYQRVIDYFGTVPFRHYTMHQELLTPISPRHEYGMSMEHLDSSTYYLAASSGLTARSTADDDARVLYNFAHHIAHAWV
jgi:predicted metalloprotease with PDZ domain